MIHLIIRLWFKFPKKRRRQFTLLFLLIVISTFTELFAIGAIIPFISALTNPELTLTHLHRFMDKLGLSLFFSVDKDNFQILFTLMFMFAVLISGFLRVFLVYFNTKVSFAAGNDIGVEMFKRTLYQKYETLIEKNSSEIISGITVKAKRMINSVIMPSTNIINAALFLIFLFFIFLSFNPLVFFAGLTFFGLLYFGIGISFKKKLYEAGKIETIENHLVVKLVQEGLGGIRDIIVDNKQEFHLALFSESDKRYREASASTTFLSLSPRYVIEMMALLFLASFVFVLGMRENGISESISFLGALAIGAQRVLPILQNAFQSWASLRSITPTMEEVLDLLDQPITEQKLEESSTIELKSELAFSNVSFKYRSASNSSLRDINLTIKMGSKVGIIGETGSGKSTLLDLLMGLLSPSEGRILVDGIPLNEGNVVYWQTQIAHVPQFIFLADTSIKENIAFGVSVHEIDEQSLINSAKKAQIYDFIESLPEKWNTRIGERGVRLSGGQRQRIGIARAFYKRAKVLVLDEATSALDTGTENDVMDSINALDKNLTIIIVAHRISTIEQCDEVFELKSGKILKRENANRA